MAKFEKDFLLGASTAAHQVEGNNIHSDYWLMEHMEYSQFVEPSGDAVDHYHRYEEDIRMLERPQSLLGSFFGFHRRKG